MSTLKNLSYRKCSFQKLTQFLQKYNVLDALASNINDFLWINTCVSSTELNRPIWKRKSLSTP
jgi:hypothetical protein